jgi:hypothetical protein
MTRRAKDTRTQLERAIDERTAMSIAGAITNAIDKIAESIAADALTNPDFRQLLHEMVSRRSRAMLAELLGEPPDEGSQHGEP